MRRAPAQYLCLPCERSWSVAGHDRKSTTLAMSSWLSGMERNFAEKLDLCYFSFHAADFPTSAILNSFQELCHRTRRACSHGTATLAVDTMYCTCTKYRIMYELAVCSDGMTEAQPRSFRQNRPASEYIIWHNAHSPANRCSGCSNTCTWIRKKCRLITLMQRSQNWFRFLLP